MEKELRVYDNEVEIRVAEDGTEHITGYAVVFNSDSQDLGGFIETISPTAFRDADMTDVVALYNHDYNIILGRTPLTLTLGIDERGVKYDILPPDTTAAKDLMTSIKRGDVRGSSFGFTIRKDGDTWEKPKERGGLYRRLVTGVAKLFDVSPVVKPAYVNTDTTIAKRELGMLKDQEEVEITDKIQQMDEIEELKFIRQQKQMEVELAIEDNELDVKRIERKFEKAHKKLLEGFDRDFSIITPEDQIKMIEEDFNLNNEEE
jgi:uncharacterized protein